MKKVRVKISTRNPLDQFADAKIEYFEWSEKSAKKLQSTPIIIDGKIVGWKNINQFKKIEIVEEIKKQRKIKEGGEE